MKTKIDIPDIPEAEQTPLVKLLLAFVKQQAVIIQELKDENQQFRDEIARLKKQKTKPKTRPSQMENNDKDEAGNSPDKDKRAGYKIGRAHV